MAQRSGQRPSELYVPLTLALRTRVRTAFMSCGRRCCSSAESCRRRRTVESGPGDLAGVSRARRGFSLRPPKLAPGLDHHTLSLSSLFPTLKKSSAAVLLLLTRTPYVLRAAVLSGYRSVLTLPAPFPLPLCSCRPRRTLGHPPRHPSLTTEFFARSTLHRSAQKSSFSLRLHVCLIFRCAQW